MKKEPKFYYVYIITNLVLNKQYVGSRICYKDKIEDDIYWGSSKYLSKDYKIYGKENFTKEILKDDYQNVNDMLIGESENMHKYNTFAPNGYNRFDPITRKGFHMGGCKCSEKTREKYANIGKNRIFSIETCKKISDAKKDILLTDIHKLKISEGLLKAYDSGKIIKPDHSGEKNPMYGKIGKNNPNFGYKRNKKTCEYCNKEIAVNMYARYHGNKCKLKHN